MRCYYLFIILLITTLAGCTSVPDSMKPMSWVFDQVPPDAPENFKQGYKDGCESGFSSMTNTAYRGFYHFRQDPILRKDPVYYKTWKAYVDGKEVAPIRVNYILRGLEIPAGKHKIEFECIDELYLKSAKASTWGSILAGLVLVSLLIGLYLENKKNKNA